MKRLSTIRRIGASPLASFRAAAWTWKEVRRLAHELKGEGLEAVARISPSPTIGNSHRTVVIGVLHVMGATCLVRSAILQRWDTDHGRPRPLVIGVARDDHGFAAHAWLDGERAPSQFVELHRRPAVQGESRGPGQVLRP